MTAVNIATSSVEPAPTQPSSQPEPSSIPTQDFTTSISLEQPSNALPTSINTVSVSSLGIPSSVNLPDSGVSTLTPPSSGALPSSIGSVNVSSLSIPGGGLPGTVAGAKPVGGAVGSSSGDVSTLGIYDASGKCTDANNSPGDPGYCKTSKELQDEAQRLEEQARKAAGEARARAELEAARIRAQLAMREEIGSDRRADYYLNRMDNSQAYNQLNPKERLEYWTGLRLKIQNKVYHEREIQDLVFTLENSKVVRDGNGGMKLEYAPSSQGGGGGSAGLTQSSNANATLAAPVGTVIVRTVAQATVALAQAAAAGVAIVVCVIFCSGPAGQSSGAERFGTTVSLFTAVIGAGSWYINQMAKKKEKKKEEELEESSSMRNPAQDKPLTTEQEECLKALGIGAHIIKGGEGQGSSKDLYYDPATGDIYIKPKSKSKGGKSPGSNSGYNLDSYGCR